MSDLDFLLRRYPSDCQPSQVESLGAAGGMSGAQFWRLQTERGALVVRRWPVEHPTPERLRLIHAVLRHAAWRGVATLPLPLTMGDGSTFVAHAGHLWEIAPWLAGTADYWERPRATKLCAAMKALADFHRATIDFRSVGNLQMTGPNALVRRLTQLRAFESEGVEQLARSINESVWPELAPFARRFVAAMAKSLPVAINRLAPLADTPLALQPCLRDIWHDHVLFDGDRVTGLIDFGAIDIDTPATDVARLLGSLVEDDAPGWREGLAAYSAVRPLSDNETLAVAALDAAGTVLAGCNWLRWIYIDGRRFEDRQQVLERFARIYGRIGVIIS